MTWIVIPDQEPGIDVENAIVIGFTGNVLKAVNRI
jgi:hypothetical protein